MVRNSRAECLLHTEEVGISKFPAPTKFWVAQWQSGRLAIDTRRASVRFRPQIPVANFIPVCWSVRPPGIEPGKKRVRILRGEPSLSPL